MTERLAKIVCTLGPASSAEGIIEQMARAGMDVVRLNFSHGTHAEHGQLIERVRSVEARLAKPIAILQDLQGPKIRLGTFENGTATLRRGRPFVLTTAAVRGSADRASITYGGFARDVKAGDRVLIDDGHQEFPQQAHGRGLGNAFGRDQVGELGSQGGCIEVFESRCHDVVSAHGGRVIKSIGDSVLFVHEDVEEALETADGIITVIGRDPRMPDVRVGLASGSVIMRLGDVFGPPVNMAARLTAVARRNRVIVDDTTAALLPPERYETRRLTARPVRGFGLVEPVSVRRL